MNRDDIIRMAQNCGHWSGVTVEMNDIGLERFAALVAAAEREACAKECEKQIKTFLSTQYAVGQPMSSFKERFACTTCADAIRARSDK